MNKKLKRLQLEMTIFATIVFVIFSIIVITEKSSVFLIPKISKKFDTYIKNNYNDLNVTKSNITYKSLKYTMKLTDKNNKNHYFYIYYQNKKITDSYKEDYVEGKEFIKKLQKVIKNNIKDITGNIYKITINNKLNYFSDEVQKEMIQSANPEQIRIYILEKEFKIENFQSKEIIEIINKNITSLENNNIHPKTYSFIFTNKNDITKSIKIYNIKCEDIKNNYFDQIISDIINNTKSDLIKNTNIKYKYLN